MSEGELKGLQDRIIDLVGGESALNSDYYLTQAKRLANDAGQCDFFFSALLEIFVHLDFSEQDAIRHWQAIVERCETLSRSLQRPVGLHLALVDYFTNSSHLLSAPMLIEIHAFKQTERLAMIDGLTGVFNRRYMDIALRKEINRCERYNKELSIFILDIDNFKQLNDNKGHVFGDQVLKELCRYLKEMVREEDIVCRYGGEEFLVLLPETDSTGAFILSERIRATLKTRSLFQEEGVTISGGTATYPTSAKDLTELIKTADRALYQAKYTGKDRVVMAESDRRRFGRVARSWSLDVLPESVSNLHGKAESHYGIITRNVSLGGVQFECPSRYDIDSELALSFVDLDAGGESIGLSGKVTWAKRSGTDFVYGVSFDSVPEAMARRLNANYLAVYEDEALAEASSNN